jgi:uncharacterized protein YcsI (UPF0317 family)
MSGTTTLIATSRIKGPAQKRGEEEYSNGLLARQASRTGAYAKPSSGIAPSFIQANLLVLPSRYATDFRLLCQRNPVPCPLLADSECVGDYKRLRSYIPDVEGKAIAADLGIRRDAPKYMVYQDGRLSKSQYPDITHE